MKFYLKGLLATLFSLPLVLFSIGTQHQLMATSTMPDVGKQMTPNQCQTSCTLKQTAATPINDKEKEKKPVPAEPYDLPFIGVGWAVILAVSAAYLLNYLRWRPPDLYKLNVQYRS